MLGRPMSQRELHRHFATRFRVTESQAREFVREFAALGKRELLRAGAFRIPDLIRIKLARVRAYTGYDAIGGKSIEIPGKTIIKIKIPKALKTELLRKRVL